MIKSSLYITPLAVLCSNGEQATFFFLVYMPNNHYYSKRKMQTLMKVDVSKLLYVAPAFSMMELRNESLICQSGGVGISPGFDDEIEIPFQSLLP